MTVMKRITVVLSAMLALVVLLGLTACERAGVVAGRIEDPGARE